MEEELVNICYSGEKIISSRLNEKYFTRLNKLDHWYYLNNLWNDTLELKDKLWMLKNHKIPNHCKVCGKIIGLERSDGISLRIYCNKICQYSDPELSELMKKRALKRDVRQANLKRKETMLNKFGVEFSFQRKDVKKKLKELNQKHLSNDVLNKLDSKEWLYDQYVIQEKTSETIGKELGIYYGTVIERLRSFNITIKTGGSISEGEKELCKFVEEFYHGEILRNNRKILNPRHLDVYLPDISLAIEYNGVYYHSSKNNTEPDYHFKKFIDCKKVGIDLIQIFEDEWKNDIDNVRKYLYDRIMGLDTIKSNIMNNRFPNHRLYKEKGLKEFYISKPLIYPHKSFLIYDAGRTVWKGA